MFGQVEPYESAEKINEAVEGKEIKKAHLAEDTGDLTYFNNDRDTVQSRGYRLRLHTPNGGSCLFCETRTRLADA